MELICQEKNINILFKFIQKSENRIYIYLSVPTEFSYFPMLCVPGLTMWYFPTQTFWDFLVQTVIQEDGSSLALSSLGVHFQTPTPKCDRDHSALLHHSFSIKRLVRGYMARERRLTHWRSEWWVSPNRQKPADTAHNQTTEFVAKDPTVTAILNSFKKTLTEDKAIHGY